VSLSDVEIAQITLELGARLCGQIFGKIHEGDDTLLLTFAPLRLVLSIHPRASRLHPTLQDPPPHSRGGGALTVLVKKRLLGLRLHSLSALAPGERVVVLDFGPLRPRLVAELTGPHANVFLVEPDGRIAASLKATRSTTRHLTPGDSYVPPPATPAAAPSWRGRARFGDSPGVGERAATHYGALLERWQTEALYAQAAAHLRRHLQKLERRLTALHGDLLRVDEAAGYRKYADLLLCHLADLPARGASSVSLPDDFEDGAPLTIPLEPALDGRANAARYYRLHKRLSAGRARTAARLAQTEDAGAATRRKLDELSALAPGELAGLVARLPAKPRAPSPDTPRLPYREFHSVSGDLIWVGRSAKDNDGLTFRHARGNDLWLHTRDAAGAHVVVPHARAPVAEATLLDAATLAAHFSPLAGEAQVDVTYTQVKHLRKPRGSAAGAVFVSDAKTVRVRMESERLARLLHRDEDPLAP
jgi:predicted ribosome quality control (RQC) complex YloA/Tae2 family protein